MWELPMAVVSSSGARASALRKAIRMVICHF
jgi:hypothetical protein